MTSASKYAAMEQGREWIRNETNGVVCWCFRDANGGHYSLRGPDPSDVLKCVTVDRMVLDREQAQALGQALVEFARTCRLPQTVMTPPMPRCASRQPAPWLHREDEAERAQRIQGLHGDDRPQGSAAPKECDSCGDVTDDMEEVAPTTGRPGGLLCGDCRQSINEPECTCLEAWPGGHMPGCAFYGRKP